MTLHQENGQVVVEEEPERPAHEVLRPINLRVLLAPGVVLQEFLHALVAVAWGFKLKKVVWWSGSGGYVQVHPFPMTPYWLWGWIAVSFAPLLALPLAIFFFASAAQAPDLLAYGVLLYAGAATTFGALPSFTDMNNVWLSLLLMRHVLGQGHGFSRVFNLLIYPFLWLPINILAAIFAVVGSTDAFFLITVVALYLLAGGATLI